MVISFQQIEVFPYISFDRSVIKLDIIHIDFLWLLETPCGMECSKLIMCVYCMNSPWFVRPLAVVYWTALNHWNTIVFRIKMHIWRTFCMFFLWKFYLKNIYINHGFYSILMIINISKVQNSLTKQKVIQVKLKFQVKWYVCFDKICFWALFKWTTL